MTDPINHTWPLRWKEGGGQIPPAPFKKGEPIMSPFDRLRVTPEAIWVQRHAGRGVARQKTHHIFDKNLMFELKLLF